MKDKNKVLDYLQKHFNWSLDTSVKWMDSPNWNFGGSSPNQVVEAGNVYKVLYFLTSVK